MRYHVTFVKQKNEAIFKTRVMKDAMPRKSRLKLPPLDLVTNEPLGQRLARFRKERGYTQLELSEKTGILRELISDYERGRLRPNYEVIIRFALALEISADELLGIKPSTYPSVPTSP